MNLGDVPTGQMVIRPGADYLRARVLGHEPSGTLVLAIRRKEIPFGGQLVRHNESRAEVWSNATQVEPVGQLTLPLG